MAELVKVFWSFFSKKDCLPLPRFVDAHLPSRPAPDAFSPGDRPAPGWRFLAGGIGFVVGDAEPRADAGEDVFHGAARDGGQVVFDLFGAEARGVVRRVAVGLRRRRLARCGAFGAWGAGGRRLVVGAGGEAGFEQDGLADAAGELGESRPKAVSRGA
jgi:hypothetical protein